MLQIVAFGFTIQNCLLAEVVAKHDGRTDLYWELIVGAVCGLIVLYAVTFIKRKRR